MKRGMIGMVILESYMTRIHVSSNQNPGYVVYMRDDTTQFYGVLVSHYKFVPSSTRWDFMECHVTLKRFFVQMLAIFRRCKNWRSTLKLNRKPSKKPSGSVPCWGHREKGDVMGSKGWWMMNPPVFLPPEWILWNHPFHFSAVGAWKGEFTGFLSKNSRLNDLLG